MAQLYGSMGMSFRKPQLVPLLFITVAFCTLFSLGTWQVQRMQWKHALIADIEKGQALPALGTLPEDPKGLEYRSVALTGTFHHDKVLHMIGHPHAAKQGFYI